MFLHSVRRHFTLATYNDKEQAQFLRHIKALKARIRRKQHKVAFTNQQIDKTAALLSSDMSPGLQVKHQETLTQQQKLLAKHTAEIEGLRDEIEQCRFVQIFSTYDSLAVKSSPF